MNAQTDTAHAEISDETLMRHIAWCGVFVAVIALTFAWVANTVG